MQLGRLPLDVQQQASVTRYFRANQSLYLAFSQTCGKQFPQDLTAMDAAIEAGAPDKIRRVAHNLKSVLHMLGYEQASEQALAIELAVTENISLEKVSAAWPELRQRIERLIGPAFSLSPPTN
jgi:HPt (histidine-containing phosphotransfer) domain-containing protein